MPRDFSRTRRIGELIQRELAVLLQREARDPRLALVSITSVEVTRDLGFAKVYYTVMDSGQQTDEVQAGLVKAGSFLRYELGQRIKLRIIPRLEFCYDKSVLRGAELSRLIDNVVADDKKRYHDDEDS